MDSNAINHYLLSRHTGLLILSLLTVSIGFTQLQRFRFSENKMGSPFNIIFYADDSLKAMRLAKECYAQVDSMNRVLSDYDSTSELNTLCRNAGKQFPSPLLWDLLLLSQKAFLQSHGAFDVSVGNLSRIWRKARKEKKFPDSGLIRQALLLTGFQKIRFNHAEKSIYIPAGTRLDFGGIAKGYAAQTLVEYLRSKGILHALADAGGDMAMTDAPPGTRGWTVGVNIPETTDELLAKRLLLKKRAVATSGDAYQYIEHEGKKYSHIIDPRTGYGIQSQKNVTVIAGDGATADWLATACSILPIEEAKQLASKMHAELMVTVVENDIVIYHKTKGFDRFWKP